jgi:hypothetical protein
MGRYIHRHNAAVMNREPTTGYATFEEFVLAHGEAFTPPTKPRPKGFRKGTNKMCFRNATHATFDRDGWTYVEGFATGMIGVHHAWALDPDGNVVETTWKDSGTAYFGVRFPKEVVSRTMVATNVYGVANPVLLDALYEPEDYMERLKANRRSRRAA